MSDKSERTYYWMDARANRLSKGIDSNRGRLLLIAIFAWLGIWGIFLEGRDDLDTTRRLIRGMGPELAGIVIAAVTINALAERRLEQERKAQLIRQMGSKYRDVTEMAIIELKYKGWLEDGSLRKADLFRANLSGADLSYANLSWVVLSDSDLTGANLAHANMSNTNLSNTDLRGATLLGADLSEAFLWNTNLSGADLREAIMNVGRLHDVNFSEVSWEGAELSGFNLVGLNLSKAFLWGADLSRSCLRDANLSGASLRKANLSETCLWDTNLSEATLWEANLSGADLMDTNLSGAIANEVNFSAAMYWTIEQLEQVATLEGAIMPDQVQLRSEKEMGKARRKGPTFEEWKIHYLAEYGGTVTDVRNTDEPDNRDRQVPRS